MVNGQKMTKEKRKQQRKRQPTMRTMVPRMRLIGALLLTACSAHAAHPDTHPSCAEWAERGECERNPNYMLASCATSCAAINEAAAAADAELAAIGSVFELQARDLDGNAVDFGKFQGQVTILTNVASYCGYTETHYTQLVELWSQLRTENVNILAFPCNQFGEQEPGTADEIKRFAKGKGVEFTMMEKVNVNGPEASIVYKYLKAKTGLTFIQWNFATYFVIGPDGGISIYNGIEPLELKEVALSMLREEL